jgi:hypothetical protein
MTWSWTRLSCGTAEAGAVAPVAGPGRVEESDGHHVVAPAPAPGPDRDGCRYCGKVVDWTRPGGIAFHDAASAHVLCYEQAEVARILAAAERVLAGVVGTSDEGELTGRGEPLP